MVIFSYHWKSMYAIQTNKDLGERDEFKTLIYPSMDIHKVGISFGHFWEVKLLKHWQSMLALSRRPTSLPASWHRLSLAGWPPKHAPCRQISLILSGWQAPFASSSFHPNTDLYVWGLSWVQTEVCPAFHLLQDTPIQDSRLDEALHPSQAQCSTTQKSRIDFSCVLFCSN